MKKVVVAFSGGLDTSYTVMYLAREMGYEVHAACADTGGFSPEQLRANEENAYKLGAAKYVTLDVTREYYDKSLRFMVYGNVLRNGTYPISVSSERIFQAAAIARYANEIGADAIAHGSTGAGNDQVRFDTTFMVLCPGMEIITLTRDGNLSRREEIDYLNAHGFNADFAKLKYSYNVGLWGPLTCPRVDTVPAAPPPIRLINLPPSAATPLTTWCTTRWASTKRVPMPGPAFRKGVELARRAFLFKYQSIVGIME